MLHASSPPPSTPRELAWHGALTARMNAIYYQRILARTQRLDSLLRFASILLASGGVYSALQFVKLPWLTALLGLLAATASGLTIALRLPDRARAAGALLPMYVRGYQRLRNLYLEGADDREAVNAALADLDQAEIAETEKAPVADTKALDEAQAAVLKEIGAAP